MVEFGVASRSALSLSIFSGMVTKGGGRGSRRGEDIHTLPKWLQQVEGVNTGRKCKRYPQEEDVDLNKNQKCACTRE